MSFTRDVTKYLHICERALEAKSLPLSNVSMPCLCQYFYTCETCDCKSWCFYGLSVIADKLITNSMPELEMSLKQKKSIIRESYKMLLGNLRAADYEYE